MTQEEIKEKAEAYCKKQVPSPLAPGVYKGMENDFIAGYTAALSDRDEEMIKFAQFACLYNLNKKNPLKRTEQLLAIFRKEQVK